MAVRKIPLNFFGIPFGLAGLGETWATVAAYHHTPAAVADVLFVVSAACWLIVVGAYLRHLAADRSALGDDLRDPIAGPFASLALITPILLAGLGLYPHAATAGRVLTDIFVVLTVLLGGWLTGQWIYTQLDLDKVHPGYFLPTVAGGLVGSASAAVVGQRRLAEFLFGLGMISWIVVGSIMLGRLFFRPMLPAPLRPTLAIEVAPAAVASIAWFALHGNRIDTVATALAGYGVLMVIAQLRLLPAFWHLPFMPSTWAFTFSWAAVATVAVVWLQSSQVSGYRVWQYLALAAVSVLIGSIAARTVVAIARRQLLPRPAQTAQSTPAPRNEAPLVTTSDRR